MAYSIAVPVFNGFDATRRCLTSLERHAPSSCRIVLVDDASTDARIPGLLAGFAARRPNTTLVANDRNLGFVGAVNRAIRTADRDDVVVLNSDTQVARGWLEGLAACRASSAAIGIVCPLSDRATILSLAGVAGLYRAADGSIDVDALAETVRAASVRSYIRLPTAVGFCMLLTRELLDRVGLFDEVYGRGYGEENDLSMRALDQGFEIACADGVFVHHAGMASFGEVPAIDAHREGNRARLARRWPGYEPGVAAWSRRNPLRATLERVNAQAERERLPGRPRVLQVLHRFDTQGGIEEHTRAIMERLHDRVVFTVVVPEAMGGAWTDMRVERPAPHLRIVRMNFDMAEPGIRVIGHRANVSDETIENAFRALLEGGYDVVHIQSLVGWNTVRLPRIARESGARVVLSAHDLSLLCADYNMMTGPRDLPCGRERARGSDTGCVACLRGKSEAVGAVRPPPAISAYIESRHAALAESLESADVVVAPSRFIADRMRSAFGEGVASRTSIVGHGVREYPNIFSESTHSMLRVAFLGRFNDRKGADVLIAAARALAGARIVFEVWGHTEARAEARARDAGMIIRGPYSAAELEAGLRGIDLVVVPSTMEEAYCLVVDEAQRLGIPLVAARTGAIPERVRDGDNGFLFPPGDAGALARLLVGLRDDRSRINAVAARLRTAPLKTLDENARDYLDLYGGMPRPAGQLPAHNADGADIVRRCMGFPRSRARTPLGTDEYDRWLEKDAQEARPSTVAMPMVMLRGKANDIDEARRVNLAIQGAETRWVAVMQEGDVLAPYALQRLAAACESNPGAALVYCDDDCVSAAGERYDPRFKPPFSAELMRHDPYIAGLCAVDRERFLATGGLREAGWRGMADVALKLASGGRSRSIVALRELLCHRLEANSPVRHEPGAAPLAAAPGAAKFAVLVRAQHAPDLAASCIDTLLHRSGARIAQLLLDLDAADCERIARARPGIRLEPAGQARGKSALAAALERAGADRMVIVDARCVNFRAGWIEELESGLDSGAAGACMAVRAVDDAIAGWDVLGGGPYAVAGPPPSMRAGDALAELYGAPRDVTVLGLRLSIVRREIALAAVSREEMDAAGPFDMAHLSVELTSHGHALVSRPAIGADFRGAAGPGIAIPEATPSAVRWMRDKWGATLADSRFHPSLRLTGQRLAPLPRFGPRRGKVPRICAFPFDRWGTGEMRVRQPVAALAREGRADVVMMSEHDSGEVPNPLEWRRLEADALYAHNFLHDYQLLALEQCAEFSTSLRVTGLDDLLTAIPAANPYAATIYPDIARRIERAIALSDRLIVTTQPLAEAYGRHAKDVRVIPNALDDRRWGALVNAPRRDGRRRVGWAGARQHLGDLSLLEPVVRATCHEVDWIFFGMCPPGLRRLAREVYDMVPVNDYPARLASLGLDIAVAPLEDHPFNRAKSNLRLLECGILGIPVVASAVTPYLDSPASLVGADPAQWIDAITALVADPHLAKSKGEQMRRWVLDTGMLSGKLDLWRRALDREG
jgi:GT2 family glycosyltransferase/glycosyltransferase involved in cell wall biosynthesis